MQTQSEIRKMLRAAGISPRRRRGQRFLIDRNLMGRLLELADVPENATVLEIGAGTGSLTEELLKVSGRVVAVEVDRRLAKLLRERLGERSKLELIITDALASKHALAPEVLKAAGARAYLVSNLPYAVATPVVVECLLSSWRAASRTEPGASLFERLTFTVQQEVAERIIAPPGGGGYGPVSVLVALLGAARCGPAVPASAFWPRPKVASRIVRIDFDAERAPFVPVDELLALLSAAFSQRRKQIGSLLHRKDLPHRREDLCAAFRTARIDPALRPQQVSPEGFCALARALVTARGSADRTA